METYIFLTNQYLPEPGATGLCIHKIASALATEDNEVYTVCYKFDGTPEEADNVSIIGVKTPTFLNESKKKTPISSLAKRVASIQAKLAHIRSYPLRSVSLVNRYISEVDKIMTKRNSAKIIASYTPLEAVVAAAKLKKKYGQRIKAVYYSADTLSNEQGKSGILTEKYRRKQGYKWETKLFSACDRILIMDCHKGHYFSDEYREYKDKMSVVNFPLFCNLSRHETAKKEDKTNRSISLVYTGTLYKELRNPRFLCDCLVKLSKIKNINVDFLGGGDCDSIIENAVKNSKGTIKYHGMQSHDIALQYIESADVLLSIGNAESPMAPSKIYEYMSTGKPIIHVFSWDGDTCIAPLKDYGNALLIQDKDINAIKKIRDFLEDIKIVSYKELEEKFKTSLPEYTVKILRQV